MTSSTIKFERRLTGFATCRPQVTDAEQRHKALYPPIKKAHRARQRFAGQRNCAVPGVLPRSDQELRGALIFQEAEQFVMQAFQCHGALRWLVDQSISARGYPVQGGSIEMMTKLNIARAAAQKERS